MRTCYQKLNKFGWKLSEKCDGDAAFHIGDPNMDSDDNCSGRDCFHHIPMYDEFDAWAYTVRNKRAKA